MWLEAEVTVGPKWLGPRCLRPRWLGPRWLGAEVTRGRGGNGAEVSVNQSQMTFDNLLGYILSIEPFSLFQNLELGKASVDDKFHFAISWARCCQYQCVCKSLSKYSKRFNSFGHSWAFFTFCLGTKSSQTVRWQNQMLDYRAHSENRLTFLGSCNLIVW